LTIIKETSILQNICLELEYDGSNYFGWQIQKSAHRSVTIQSTFEQALKKLFKKPVKAVSSGRTDSGVHAKTQVVNFKILTPIPLENIKIALNGLLPSDIRILKIKKKPPNFHARFSVRSKIYEYLIYNQTMFPVFKRNYYWHVPGYLNLNQMRRASLMLIGKYDFASFASKVDREKSSVRSLKSIRINKKNSVISIKVEASGFLRGMVRNIVAALVDVGKGEVSVSQVKRIKRAKNRSFLGKSAPACGLYLLKVKYK